MTDSAVDLRDDPLLRREFAFARPSGPERDPASAGVLVTGANSYIALHVMAELLDTWPGPVHVLLRARDGGHARERLLDAAGTWGLPLPDLDRVRFHVGEVSAEGWRLDEAERARLDEEVEHVVHLALPARYDLPWAAYRETWIPELVRMVEWCGGARPKTLHYPGSYNTHFLREDRDFQRIGTTAWTSGYTAFKWAAERVLARAVAAGLPACYYDIPLVLGTAARGLCPRMYAAILIVNVFLRARAGIDVGQFRLVPVDVLARALVANARAAAGERLAFVRPVLERPITFEVVAEVLAALGRPLRKVSWQEFASLRSELRKFVEFFLPEGFADLITATHDHPAIFPAAVDPAGLPDALEVLRANCRVVYGRRS